MARPLRWLFELRWALRSLRVQGQFLEEEQRKASPDGCSSSFSCEQAQQENSEWSWLSIAHASAIIGRLRLGPKRKVRSYEPTKTKECTEWSQTSVSSNKSLRGNRMVRPVPIGKHEGRSLTTQRHKRWFQQSLLRRRQDDTGLPAIGGVLPEPCDHQKDDDGLFKS